MATLVENAALAAYIYNNERGVRTPINRLDLPGPWVALGPANGFPAQASYDDNFFTFTAGAFVNSSTGEDVVSYKGTDFLWSAFSYTMNTWIDYYVVPEYVSKVSLGRAVNDLRWSAAA